MAKVRAGVVALAFFGWCGLAHALALGDIQVHSHLNQVLNAEIPISVSNPGEADDLIVELASNEEFEQQGIERAEFLSSLRFAVEGGAIRVYSKQIAREPFITFLLNVRWAGGRLVREYTVLLDPPTMAGSRVTRPQAATAAAAPSASTAAPQKSTATPPAAAPSAEAPSAPAEAAAAPEAPAEAAPSAAAAAGGGTYGPVSPKETLWSIAYKLRPDPSLTMDQVQIAFVNANPKAFENGKVNGLRKGSMLRVPTADEIRAVDPVSAKAEVAAARGAAPASVATAEPPTAPLPRAEAPAPAEPAPAPAPAPKSEPKVEPAPAPQAAEPAPQAVSPPPQPAATPPPAQGPPTEVAQTPQPPPAAESAAAPSQASAPATAPAPETKPAPATETKPAPAQKKPAAAPESDVMSTVLDTVRGIAENEYARYGLALLVALAILIPVGRRVGATIAKARYERAARKAAEPQAAPALGDDEVTQVAQEPSTEQALHEAAADGTPTVVTTQTQTMAPMGATQALGDTMQQTMAQTVQQTQVVEPSLASSGKVDFDVTGTFADQTVQIKLDAGDPVSEAEFHRAYGLYDEAALLLKQALEKDPKRTDARVKLAEIYFEASKANEFVEVAKQLKGQLPEAEWQKIALLGTQIAPNNELFSGAGGGGGTVDISFDEPAAPAAPTPAPAPATPAAPAEDAGLDFKLEDVQLDVPAAAAPAATPPAAPAEGGLEFDLGGLSLDTPAASAPTEVAPAAAPPTPDAGLDLGNFDLGATEAAPAATAASGDVVEMSADLSVGDVPAAGDESSTKLDLARAYIDMGDNDMAKSLLNEVAQQGNDQQKKEAQELLKRVPA